MYRPIDRSTFFPLSPSRPLVILVKVFCRHSKPLPLYHSNTSLHTSGKTRTFSLGFMLPEPSQIASTSKPDTTKAKSEAMLPSALVRAVILTSLGPACPQIPGISASIDSEVVTQLNFNGPTAEDCFNLAIWAPLIANAKKLPVFIILFGSGYTTGGIDVNYQIPDNVSSEHRNRLSFRSTLPLISLGTLVLAL
jgi:Carboxylesterase type B